MKFSITRLFDITSTLATSAGKDLKDLIETLTQLLDQTLRLSQNNITIDDNLKTKRISLTVRNDTTDYVLQGIPSGSPALVLLANSTAPLDNPLLFNWKYDGRNSKVNVYIKPTSALSIPITVEIILFFK